MPIFVSNWICAKCGAAYKTEQEAQWCEDLPIANEKLLHRGLIFELQGAICVLTGNFDTGTNAHLFQPHAWRFEKGGSGAPAYVRMGSIRCDVVPDIYKLFMIPHSLYLPETRNAIKFAKSIGAQPSYFGVGGKLVFVD